MSQKETQSEILKHILPAKKYKVLQKIIYGNITLDAPPAPLVRKTLQKIFKKQKLFIISRRKVKDRNVALRWLSKYQILNTISKKDVFFTERKDKNFLCKKLKITIYLDDEVKILKKLRSVPYPILYNPHRVPINGKFLEVESWKEIPNLLGRINK